MRGHTTRKHAEAHIAHVPLHTTRAVHSRWRAKKVDELTKSRTHASGVAETRFIDCERFACICIQHRHRTKAKRPKLNWIWYAKGSVLAYKNYKIKNVTWNIYAPISLASKQVISNSCYSDKRIPISDEKRNV